MKNPTVKIIGLVLLLDILMYGIDQSRWMEPVEDWQNRVANEHLIPKSQQLQRELNAVDPKRRNDFLQTLEDRWGVFAVPLNAGAPEMDDWLAEQIDPSQPIQVIEDGLNQSLYLKTDSGELWLIGPFSELDWIAGLDRVIIFSLLALLHLAVLVAVLLPTEKRLKILYDALGVFKSDTDTQLPVDHGEDRLGKIFRLLQAVQETVSGRIDSHNKGILDQRDLLHAVAHEFRNPMARLQFALEMLAQTNAREERDELIENMDKTLEELDSLVKEVLSYSRLQDGKYPLELSNTTVHSIVQGAVEKLEALYPDLAFNYDLEKNPDILMHCDVRLASRAIINLVRNAARFAQQRVQIKWKEDPLYTFISIGDDGPGIPPGKRKRIFEPFTRLDPSRSRDSGGIGLGLAIVKGICDRHRATVTVADCELGGAEFQLTFPRQSISHNPLAVGKTADFPLAEKATLK